MRLLRHLLVLAALPSLALAQGPAVGLVAAAASSSTDCRFTDVEAKLMATGLIGSVGIFNTTLATPTLADLQQYDAILAWTNFSPLDNAALGDVMADYVDAGGGVVVAVFANSTTNTLRHIAGRWQTGGYEVIVALSGSTTGSAALGTVVNPAHPVMQGITSFSGGSSSFRPTGTALTPGSNLIAEWSDGSVLAAEGASPQRLDLGFYPPSSDCSGTFWVSSTQGGELMANALVHVGGGVGSNYCTATANSTGSPAGISSSGSASFSANNLVLRAEPVPNQNGIFFYGPGSQQIPFGNGFLCVTPTFGRLGIELASGNVLTHSYDNTAPPNPQTQVSPGTTWYFQGWFRDPAAGGANFNFSDGLELTYVP